MDSYFKLLHAEEEIQCLNIKIARFATYIHDENIYLHYMEQQIHTSQPALAFQIHLKCAENGHYEAVHMKILNQITSLKGFTGSTLYGTHIPDATPPIEVPMAPITQQEPLPASRSAVEEENASDREQDLEEEQAGEDRDDAVLGAYYSVLELSYDNPTVHLTALDNVHM